MEAELFVRGARVVALFLCFAAAKLLVEEATKNAQRYKESATWLLPLGRSVGAAWLVHEVLRHY